MPDLSVIVPTYCEEENLPELIYRIDAAVRSADLQVEILIIDDDSPDETEAICRGLSEHYPVRLIVRKSERGLASAVITGMRAAQGSVLVCLDADLSHPPEKIPELYSALMSRRERDFAIGSRYVAGGGTDEKWGWFRQLNSRVATCLAWPLTDVSDPMAGFFALRRSTFVQAEELDPVGFKIALELIVKCRCQEIAEVPIQFHDRKRGESKLNFKEQFYYLCHLKRLYTYRFSNLTSLVLFGCVGLTGFAVDLVLFFFWMRFVSVKAAAALAIFGAMTWNYILNRKVTFRGTPQRRWLRQYLAFCASCALGGCLNWITRIALVTGVVYFATHPFYATALGVASGMGFNFLICRFFVFARSESIFRPETNIAPQPLPKMMN